MRDLVRRRQHDDALRPWERLRKEINDLFDWNYSFGNGEVFDGRFMPTVDVVDNPNNIEITCDVPGVTSEDIDISISGNVLTIKGEKKGEEEKKNAKVYRKENWYGSFQRSITLPNTVDADKVDAEMKNGVLKLTLPKKEEAKQKKIAVNVT